MPDRPSDQDIINEHPAIMWNEPIVVRLTGSNHVHYGCRLCIAQNGLKGSDIPWLPTDAAVIVRHLKEAHGLT